jgi:hypothetical protein
MDFKADCLLLLATVAIGALLPSIAAVGPRSPLPPSRRADKAQERFVPEWDDPLDCHDAGSLCDDCCSQFGMMPEFSETGMSEFCECFEQVEAYPNRA